MRCPSCFVDKGTARSCPACGFEEQAHRLHRFLPYRHELKQGRYIVGRVLGSPGGFGIAYKAWDSQRHAMVVIKECLLTESSQVSREAGDVRVEVNPGYQDEYRRWLDRFNEEASLIAKYKSDYIVRVSDSFEENNTAYYVMPYVEGDNLRNHCAAQGGRLTQDEVTDIALKLLSALTEVHASGWVHRDIKPSNILITKNRHKPVLIDFGAARDTFDQERSGSHLAIFGPLAPIEQLMVRADQGPWTDIYSLSATLYQCLVGTPPPKADVRESLRKQGHDPFVPIHEHLPDLHSGLAMVINNGLALSPKQRLRDTATAMHWLDDKTKPREDTGGPAAAPPPLQPAPRWTPADLAPLLPALLLIGYGLLATPRFGRFLDGWPGLFVVVNGVAWALWLRHRRVAPSVQQFGPTTSGLGPTHIPPPPNQIAAIEVRLESPGVDAVIQVVKPLQTLVVGRTNMSDLVMPNLLLSKRHVSITATESGEFALRDLDSMNHTYEHRRGNAQQPDAWKRIRSASGRKGRFMLGPPDGGGVLLEIRQTSVDT